eukprot:gene12803-15751_t
MSSIAAECEQGGEAGDAESSGGSGGIRSEEHESSLDGSADEGDAKDGAYEDDDDKNVDNESFSTVSVTSGTTDDLLTDSDEDELAPPPELQQHLPEATGTCDAFWLNETTIADGDAGAKAGSAEETASGNGVKGAGEVAGEAAESAAATVGTVWGWGSLEGLAGVLLQWPAWPVKHLCMLPCDQMAATCPTCR